MKKAKFLNGALTILLSLALFPSKTFAAPLEFTQTNIDTVTTYLRPLSLDAVDLDEDGDVDVVIGDQYYDDILWYSNNGSEVFTKTTIDSNFVYPRMVKVADLDGDSDLDIIASRWDETVWYQNDGSENFTKIVINGSAAGEVDFQIIDLDGDTDLDIAAVDYTNGQVLWYDNDGSENFTRRTINAVNDLRFAYSIAVQDFDGDTDLDIVAGNQDYTIALFTNDGSENFTKTNLVTDFSVVQRIAAVDLDGDTDYDVVATSANGDGAIWLDNNGSAIFTRKTIGSSSDIMDFVVDDMDGDGDEDVIIADGDNADVIWFDNDGSETFTKRYIDSYFTGARSVDVIDVDGDTDLDVVVGSSNGGQGNPGDTLDWYQAAPDTSNPTISTLSPADNTTAVATTANLIMTFGENVVKGTGNIVIKKTSDDSTVETIDVTSGLVTVSNNVVTINPGSDLVELTEYYVQVATTAFDDESANSYAGITDTTSWSFTTADETNPTVSTLSPADNATGVDIASNLVITFDENIAKGTGNIVIKKTSDDSTVETIDVTSGLVTVSTDTATINPASDLAELTEFYIQVAATAFDDSSGNSYAGITDTTSWSFTTGDQSNPTVSTLSPADNATAVATTANLVMTFGENVDAETGNIVIKKTSDDSTVETIDVTSGLVTISNNVVTINPASDLAELTEFYVQVDVTAFDDASGNSYVGISDTTSWSFTTADETNPTVSTLSPTDDATSVSVDSDLVITFSENVDVESGNIVIKKASDDTVFETIAITGTEVTGTGTTTITINPTGTFREGANYYVQIDATAFDDASSNSYAGISDTSSWNFTAYLTPVLAASPTPTSSGGGGGGGYRSGSAPWSSSSASNSGSWIVNQIHKDSSDNSKSEDSPNETGSSSKFSDLTDNHKNAKAIYHLQKEGVIQGYENGTFLPEGFVNRAESIKIFVTSRDIDPDPEKYNNCFSDVHDEWFARYICYAKEAGWINGYPDGSFGPEKTVIRVELLKILFQSNDIRVPEIESANPPLGLSKDEWYSKFLLKGYELGLMSGSEIQSMIFDEEMQRGATCQCIYDLENLTSKQ